MMKKFHYIILVLLLVSINMIGAEDCQSLCCHTGHHKTDKTNNQICVLQASQFCQNTNKKILVVENKIVRNLSNAIYIQKLSAIRPNYKLTSTFYNNYFPNLITKPFTENNPPLII
jgi:hypothetical protein